MKSFQSRTELAVESPILIRNRFNQRRNGSVLLVVIGMLGILLLAGIAFYTFASQENSSADFYSDAAKVPPAPKMIADVLFDYALEQLIVGPDDSLTQSALRGGRREPVQDMATGAYYTQIPGRHSLLAGVIGNDGSVYNGEGIKLSSDAGGNPFVDMDQDGTPDPTLNSYLLNLNFSASANAGTLPNLLPYPSLDTGFTSPDINSPYLAYSSGAIDNTTPIANEYPVLMPSFHRPQYLRGGVATLTAPGNAPRLFRPHPDNLCKSGTMPRFLATPTVHPTLGHTIAAFPMSANVNGTAISQGLWDLTGAPSGSPAYNWDVDNDGDGIREGVWLDLDFPVSELADGRSCVPMFSFTVMDADGLMNLNTSGNSYLWTHPPSPGHPSTPPTVTNYVHRSNMGLSRSEINPMWGLYADATVSGTTYFNSNGLRDDALLQHRVFWNLATTSYPSAKISSIDTANMEFLALLNGRAQFLPAPTGSYMLDGNRYMPMQYMPGRHGEGGLLSTAIAPPTGTSTAFVDNFIPAAGVRLDPAFPAIGNPGDDDADQNPISFPFMGHPVDYRGFGSGYEFRPDPVNPSNFQLTQMLLGKWDFTTNTFDLTNPIRWPAYNSYSNVGNGNRVGYTISSDSGGMDDILNPSTPSATPTRLINAQTSMIDEEDEGIAEPNMTVQFSLNDFMYDANEMFGLHGANSDFNSAATGSRLRNLAPFNFALNNQAAAIRSQYTTLSMDRFQFGTGLNGNRAAFEVNADADNDTFLEFPPVTIDKTGTSPFESLRLAVRKQLTVEFGADLSGSVHNNSGFKLNMNQIMDLDLTGAAYSRDLTFHPTIDPGAATLMAVPYANVAATPQTQEYWARRDRQWLARDIYVLLYILGGGNDAQHYQAIGSGMGADPDDNTARNIYTDAQLKEMAQFAVNYVDAMDPDQNITKFEYDKNLGDGWQLDDEAYNDEGGADRGEVYGVELQALTFSESVVIKTIPLPSSKGDNTQVTTYDDTVGRFYTAIELRNAAPYDVDFIHKSWRIRILDTVDPARERTLTFYDKTVPAGTQFTIGSRSGSDNDTTGAARPSDFRVNFDFDTEGGIYKFDTIIPAQGSTSGLVPAAPAPQTGADPGWDTMSGKGDFNLDLVTDAATKFDLKAGAIASAVGEFISDAGTTVTFVIERRTNIARDSSSNTIDADNPWVEVDRMTANVQIFDLNSGALPSDLAVKLPKLTSKERPEPFEAANEGVCTRDNPASDKQITYRPNTIGVPRNSLPAGAAASDPFRYWQPHFDRPYTSTMDLLTLPLFQPSEVTTRLAAGVTWLPISNFAQEKFLRPIHPDNVGNAAPNADLNNHWHRLLNFLAAPNRTQTAVNLRPASLRTPGLINLNTIRHRGVFAGLVDDFSSQFAPGALDAANPNQLGGHFALATSPLTLDSAIDDTPDMQKRDWYGEFLRSRDGQDPVTQLYLPGMAHSRPFRPLNFADSGVLGQKDLTKSGVEHTILRSLHKDLITGKSSRRGLFEASRSYNDPFSDPLVDFHTRHRLLRKVANNSTTRSNVFVLWISVGMFEAIQQPNGDVQIGGPISGDGSPDYRGFFVIDRSLPETALDQTTLKFDFRKFVSYRKTLQ
jgi:hypothetical protein